MSALKSVDLKCKTMDSSQNVSTNVSRIVPKRCSFQSEDVSVGRRFSQRTFQSEDVSSEDVSSARRLTAMTVPFARSK